MTESWNEKFVKLLAEKANCPHEQYEKPNLKFNWSLLCYGPFIICTDFVQNYAAIFLMETKYTANIKLRIIYTYITQYRTQPQTGKHFVHNSWLITMLGKKQDRLLYIRPRKKKMLIEIDSLHTLCCLKVMKLLKKLITFTSLNSI